MNSMILKLILTFLLISSYAGANSKCTNSDLKRVTKKGQPKVLACIKSDSYIPGKSVYILAQNYLKRSGENSGITVSIFPIGKNGAPRSFPMYQESGFGDALLEFNLYGKNSLLNVTDVNGDGRSEWIIRAHQGAVSNIYMKYYDKSARKFEQVPVKRNEIEEAKGTPLVADASLPVKIKKNEIEVLTATKKYLYKLNKQAFEFVAEEEK